MTQAKKLHISCNGISTIYMDGRCQNSCLLVVSKGEKASLALIKNSYKTMTKTVTRDIYLRLMLIILRNYARHSATYHSYLKGIKIDMCEKLVCNMYDKKNHIIHMRALKQAQDQVLILDKVHRVIKFSQEAKLKPFIDMNTELRTKVKNDFAKNLFKLMNKSVFGKTTENVRKHRGIKLGTAEEVT